MQAALRGLTQPAAAASSAASLEKKLVQHNGLAAADLRSSSSAAATAVLSALYCVCYYRIAYKSEGATCSCTLPSFFV
jgi:hypothetical protein